MAASPFAKSWTEIWFEDPRDNNRAKRLDGRKRTPLTARRIASELRATGNYAKVWLVVVNRLKRAI